MTTETRTVSAPARPSRVGVLWRSQVGKKALMAATGAVLALYVVGHLLGNLQVFLGPAKLNGYAALLHASPTFLWTARVILLAALVVHVVAALELQADKQGARPTRYALWRPTTSTPASRSMIWSGLLILAFVVYHLLDLTVGVANPDFRAADTFHNVVVSFGRGLAVLAYLIAMGALGFHLWHGLWSMSQSAGLSTQRSQGGIQRAAAALAVLLALGFAAIPVAVLVGLVR